MVGTAQRAVPAFLIFSDGVVRITIEPAFARLRRRDDGVPAGPRMVTVMAVRRIVAAKSHPTLLTGAQMDPTPADFHALFALPNPRDLDRPQRRNVFARARRHYIPFRSLPRGGRRVKNRSYWPNDFITETFQFMRAALPHS